MSRKNLNPRPVIFVVFVFFFGIFVDYKYRPFRQAAQGDFTPIRAHDNKLNLINPLIGCNFNESRDFREYLPLKNKISDYIEEKKAESSVSNVSVYFRQLEKGRWFGINENDKFEPASLFKVPIMIAFYKKSETDQNLLSNKLYYFGDESKGPSPSSNGIVNTEFLSVGKSYTISELINSMITNSDNQAKDLLVNNMDSAYLNEIFSDLGMLPPTDQSTGISAKMYSLFFRVLYNSTYLNRNTSENAMELMTKTTFNGGLTKLLPAETVVAHKYGEHGIFNGGKLVGAELHDCGIIYGKASPYLLCVMTRGTNINNLKNVIQNISAMVYKN